MFVVRMPSWSPAVAPALAAVADAFKKARRPHRVLCEECTSDREESLLRAMPLGAMNGELLASIVGCPFGDPAVVPWALPRVIEALFVQGVSSVQGRVGSFIARGAPYRPDQLAALEGFFGVILDEVLDVPPAPRYGGRSMFALTPQVVLELVIEAQLDRAPLLQRWTARRSSRAATHLARAVQRRLFDPGAAAEALAAALERWPEDSGVGEWREALGIQGTGGSSGS